MPWDGLDIKLVAGLQVRTLRGGVFPSCLKIDTIRYRTALISLKWETFPKKFIT